MRILYVLISQRNFFLQSYKNEIGYIRYHIYFVDSILPYHTHIQIFTNLIQIFLREYDVPEDMITKYLS